MDSMDTTTIDETAAIHKLLTSLEGKVYSKVVTTGRGGLATAQRVAYKLGLDFAYVSKQDLHLIPQGFLFVDDIVCSGETISKLPSGVDSAVLVYRTGATLAPTYFGTLVRHRKYIKFSWEM